MSRSVVPTTKSPKLATQKQTNQQTTETTTTTPPRPPSVTISLHTYNFMKSQLLRAPCPRPPRRLLLSPNTVVPTTQGWAVQGQTTQQRPWAVGGGGPEAIYFVQVLIDTLLRTIIARALQLFHQIVKMTSSSLDSIICDIRKQTMIRSRAKK